MSVIFVRRKPDRWAKTSLRGSVIPTDTFVPVVQTPFIDDLLSSGSIEVQTPKSAKSSKRETPAVVPPVPIPPPSLPGGNEE